MSLEIETKRAAINQTIMERKAQIAQAQYKIVNAPNVVSQCEENIKQLTIQLGAAEAELVALTADA